MESWADRRQESVGPGYSDWPILILGAITFFFFLFSDIRWSQALLSPELQMSDHVGDELAF